MVTCIPYKKEPRKDVEQSNVGFTDIEKEQTPGF